MAFHPETQPVYIERAEMPPGMMSAMASVAVPKLAAWLENEDDSAMDVAIFLFQLFRGEPK